MDNSEKLAIQGIQDEDKQNKNTTHYVLDITIYEKKPTQITLINHAPSYKQQQKVRTNRTSFYAEIVTDIITRN
jgi:hypothetical protein